MAERGNAGRSLLGLIINPIAGMGGSVGLKGTDGVEVLHQAIERGAVPLSAERTRRALGVLNGCNERISILAAPGPMGSDLAAELGLPFQTCGGHIEETTTPEMTQAAAKQMVQAGADLVLFAGGDGTARDVLAATGDAVPVLGIPCGVKMHSGVFAVSPEAAGELAVSFLGLDPGKRDARLHLAEVMDIDEADYRRGVLSAELYGYLPCPTDSQRLQGPKARGHMGHEDAVRSAALEIAHRMTPGRVYLIGPGTSAGAVLRTLGLEGSLLGVDAIIDDAMVGRDLSAREIAALSEGKQITLVLGVIGGQGYILGRGNQQISPRHRAPRGKRQHRHPVKRGEARPPALRRPPRRHRGSRPRP